MKGAALDFSSGFGGMYAETEKTGGFHSSILLRPGTK